MRVLLVEDDAMIAEAVSASLKDGGYAVDWVKNSAQVAAAAAAQPYDLMLLDLGLPGRDGLDVLSEIRAAGCAVPVLIVTARKEFAVLQALLARPGVILSRSDLEEKVYGWGEEVESNAVDFLIHALRKKLGKESIQNVRGVGWLVPAAV